MGTILKLIKYLAIAFVIFLLISIVGGLLGAFGFIGAFTILGGFFGGDSIDISDGIGDY